MVLYDSTIGNALHAINTAGFVYYILWVGLTPFVDSSHFSQRFFLPREYGVAIAAVFLSLIILVAVTVSSFSILLGGQKQQQLQQLAPKSLGNKDSSLTGGLSPSAVQRSRSRAHSTPPVSEEGGSGDRKAE